MPFGSRTGAWRAQLPAVSSGLAESRHGHGEPSGPIGDRSGRTRPALTRELVGTLGAANDGCVWPWVAALQFAVRDRRRRSPSTRPGLSAPETCYRSAAGTRTDVRPQCATSADSEVLAECSAGHRRGLVILSGALHEHLAELRVRAVPIRRLQQLIRVAAAATAAADLIEIVLSLCLLCQPIHELFGGLDPALGLALRLLRHHAFAR